MATKKSSSKEQKPDSEKKKDKKKKKVNYFELLAELGLHSVRAAEKLDEIVGDYDPARIRDDIREMHEIEHDADRAHHRISDLLANEFITPIEREDISALAYEIDEVTNSIDDIAMRLYMYNVQTLRPEAYEFTKLIVECTLAMGKMLGQLKEFRKLKKVRDSIILINDLEEQGDRLYMESMRTLFTSPCDAYELLRWTEIYRRMERCFDDCENVSKLVHNVIIKNT